MLSTSLAQPLYTAADFSDGFWLEWPRMTRRAALRRAGSPSPGVLFAYLLDTAKKGLGRRPVPVPKSSRSPRQAPSVARTVPAAGWTYTR